MYIYNYTITHSEGSDLSYKQDMKDYNADSQKRKNAVVLAIKITVVALTVMFLLTTVMVIVNMVGDSSSTNVGSDGSGGKDKTAPVIKLKQGDAIYAYVGEAVLLKNAVIVTDSSEYKLEVDNSQVNLDVAGVYTVTYTATDTAGNSTVFKAKVVVTRKEYSYSTLMSLVEAKAKQLGITDTMTVQEKVFAVYDFVNSPSETKSDATIYFSDESMIPNIDRANWETDWVEEAARALTDINSDGKTDRGDCYTYYSVSKAFFEYLGIENKGIERDKSQSNMSGTHFWLMVNVGTANNPQWYFYDATRLAGSFSDGTKNACLRTLSELQSYKSSDGKSGFYAFDASDYPTTSSTPISR